MPSLPDTLWVLLIGFVSVAKSRIQTFSSTCLSLIIKVLATQAKYLEPSGYCTVINCTFTFHAANICGSLRSVMVQFELTKLMFPNQCCTFICASFKSCMEWNTAQYVRAPTPVCPVGWGCRIHRLLLCRGVRPPPQRVSWIWH